MTSDSQTPGIPGDRELFVGVDVGGTNVKLGIVDDAGEVIAATAFPTLQEQGPEYALVETRVQLERLLATEQIPVDRLVAAGLGTPGSMDIAAGMILEPANLPGWRNFPVRDRLSEILNMPVFYTNDANAAAFGEYWAGAGRDCKSLVMFTLGTGIGGGIVVDDFFVEGSHSLGAELGHIAVEFGADARTCSCGLHGHVEAYASANSLVARCREALPNHPTSPLSGLPADQLTPLEIAGAAESGDRFSNDLIMETADWLSRAIALAAHTIDPEVFMIGGAMTFGGDSSAVGRQFLDRMRQKTEKMVFPEIARQLKIEFASLGSDAGFIGAAGIAKTGTRQ